MSSCHEIGTSRTKAERVELKLWSRADHKHGEGMGKTNDDRETERVESSLGAPWNRKTKRKILWTDNQSKSTPYFFLVDFYSEIK